MAWDDMGGFWALRGNDNTSPPYEKIKLYADVLGKPPTKILCAVIDVFPNGEKEYRRLEEATISNLVECGCEINYPEGYK